MNEAEIKTELIEKIEHADLRQLIELQFLVSDYFNDKETEGWDLLPENQKRQILKGLEQADAGLGKPFDEVTKNLVEKYGLND